MANTARKRSFLYEQDFYAWIQQQASAAKAGLTQELDLSNIAEELEEMGRNERNEIESRLEVLLFHLLKLEYSDYREPRRGWLLTCREQRRRIDRRLHMSPSLRPFLAEALSGCYEKAWGDIIVENLIVDTPPRACPYTLEEILDQDFIP